MHCIISRANYVYVHSKCWTPTGGMVLCVSGIFCTCFFDSLRARQLACGADKPNTFSIEKKKVRGVLNFFISVSKKSDFDFVPLTW